VTQKILDLQGGQFDEFQIIFQRREYVVPQFRPELKFTPPIHAHSPLNIKRIALNYNSDGSNVKACRQTVLVVKSSIENQASSINIFVVVLWAFALRYDRHDAAPAPRVTELHLAAAPGEERIVARDAHVRAGVNRSSSLPNQHRTGLDDLAVESLYSKASTGRIPAVP
jgi:hypothetical protein